MAEEVVNGKHTTGVADDLKKASNLAMQCITSFGMSKLLNEEAVRDRIGFRGVTDEVLVKAEALLQEELAKAKKLCEEYRYFLDSLTERLLSETTVLGLTPEDLTKKG